MKSLIYTRVYNPPLRQISNAHPHAVTHLHQNDRKMQKWQPCFHSTLHNNITHDNLNICSNITTSHVTATVAKQGNVTTTLQAYIVKPPGYNLGQNTNCPQPPQESAEILYQSDHSPISRFSIVLPPTMWYWNRKITDNTVFSTFVICLDRWNRNTDHND